MATRKARQAAMRIVWTVWLVLTCAASVHAEGLNYTLGVSLENSDNMNEAAVNPIAQTALIPRLNFDWTEQGSTLQALATGQIEYRDYLGGAFDNELRAQLAGVVNWIILPQRLNFDFEDYAGIAPVNVFASNAPGNQQQTNVFTLGPSLQFRIANELRGVADLRLTDSTASVDKQFDSQRALAAIHAIRDLNPTDALSANAEFGTVHFSDAIGDPDYRHYAVYARYQSKLSQVDLDFALGYSGVNFSDAPNNSGLLAQGKAKWQATANSAFELDLKRQYSDASQSLSVDPATLIGIRPGAPIAVSSVPVTAQVYLEQSISAAYTFQTARFNLRLTPHYSNFKYSISPIDSVTEDGATNQTAHGATLSADYALRPLWSVGFSAAEETRTYSQIDRRDEDLRYGFNLVNQLTRQWSWRADVIRNQRASTAFGQGFGENIAMLTVIFKR